MTTDDVDRAGVSSRSYSRAEFFASAADAPRTRRVNDWMTGVVALLVLLLAGWAAHRRMALDVRIHELFAGIPGWLDVLAGAAYALTGLYALVLAGIIVARGRHRALIRDLLLGVAAVLGVATLAGRVAVGEWPDLLPELRDVGTLSYPTLRVALVVSIVLIPAPHLTAPMRRFGRWVVAVSAVSGIVASATSPTAMVGGFALGLAASAAVHLAFGSPAGLPSTARLGAALEQLGLAGATVRLADRQPVGVAIARAETPDGGDYLVKVYGRDAADAELVSKFWRALWYRDPGPTLSLNGLQQVEHEAVVTLLAERRGGPVHPIELAGQDDDDNAFLVVAWPQDALLAARPADALPDALLDRAWIALDALHRADVCHGALGPRSILLVDGEIRFTDLARGSIAPDTAHRQADVASLLASLASIAGGERAIASMMRMLPPERIAAVLPYVQDAVLHPEVRRAVKDDVELDDLVGRLAEEAGLDKPEIVDLRRVSLGDVAMVIFAVFAANALISQLAEIGFDVLLEELGDADLFGLVLAFLLGVSGYYGNVISIRGAVTAPVPTAPTTLLQSAKTFVGLAVPTVAGRVAMDVRYLQKLGVPTSVALAQGPLIGFVGFLAEVTLLILSAFTLSGTFDTDSLDAGNMGLILLLVVVAVIAGIVVVFAVPALRRRVMGPLREGLAAVVDVVKTPRRLARIYGGQMFDRLGSALALAATLAAFGQGLSFGVAIFVSVGTGLLAGLMPVPGGIGVAEATMTALLTAVGIDPDVAFAVTICFRVVTSYLPPVFGWFSLRWLNRNGYL